MTRPKMMDARDIVDPFIALLCAILIQAIRDAFDPDQEIREDARRWLQGTRAAGWLVELDISPEAARERLK